MTFSSLLLALAIALSLGAVEQICCGVGRSAWQSQFPDELVKDTDDELNNTGHAWVSLT
ncbi:MAG: hypothetical protein MUO77_21400 [Anaerolineales bacterium]|nr:hypothetical protein [Anaerolineales bacterium]